ncbi:ABC transporter permease [Kitasatospora sp. CB01950]|uniref:ABC transporter permease n=1 Tax=Kitasatospora sp. CB01950 TaxID=1703930 RepID=UPI000938D9D7|nr:ABC transporter permease [Kitasatospora sp. CB01950]OKJ00062.1 ABC transporter [Kitasatospora sp. CB01950]
MPRSVLPDPATRLGLRELCAEALAGILQRPGRSALTMLGTVLGIGAFVAVLGLTATASGQIGARFDLTRATTVQVSDRPRADAGPPGANPPIGFPADADRRMGRIDGVEAAGVWWSVPGNPRLSARPADGTPGVTGIGLYAATPGAVRAMDPTVVSGTTPDAFLEATAQPVVLLSEAAATRLGVSRLDDRPAVFIDDLPYTVIGIYSDVRRQPATLLGAIVPAATALERFGNPSAEADRSAQGLIATRVGAAGRVAEQVAVALRPDAPDAFAVQPPPDPHSLRDTVTSDLTGLFLALAAICLLVGAVGIANTTLVAVLERTEEIGLRRALGARTRHIAAQFLTESTVLGTLGGLLGTSLGVLTVLGVAAAKDWTAVLQPAATLPAPLIGTAVGLLAGLYPSLRAARTDPLKALRSG